MRTPSLERGVANAQCSDGEGRGSGAVGRGQAGVEGGELRRGADGSARRAEPLRNGGAVRRDKRGDLRGEPAERALIVAMAGRGERRRRALVVDLHAQKRGVSEGRLQVGGDRSRIRARDPGRGQRLVIGDGDELDNERQRDDERRQRRTE